MSYVYLIHKEDSDRYKIGVTRKSPKETKRIKGLQTGNDKELTMIRAFPTNIPFKIETILHRVWKSKKYIPEDFKEMEGEWFKLSQQDVDQFILECTKIENHIYFLEENSTFFDPDKHI